MALFKNILGFRDFSKIDDIKKYINLNLYYNTKEDVFNAEHLLIFETTKQKTWILASNLRLFCVLDDVAKDTFQVRWDLKKNEIYKNGHVILQIRVHENYSENSGLVDFGEDHRGWLYSRKLFSNPQKIINALREMIETSMG